jgi:hypothetical protein
MKLARPFGARQAGTAFHGNAHAELFDAFRALDYLQAVIEGARTGTRQIKPRDLDQMYNRAREAYLKIEQVMGMVGEDSVAEQAACPMCEQSGKCPVHDGMVKSWDSL